MAREFTALMGLTTLPNAAVTLIFLNPPTTIGIEILRCWVGQSGSVVSAMQRIQLVTQVTAFPTLTSVTPQPTNLGDGTASLLVGNTTGAAGTAGIAASAEGAGTKTARVTDVFNVLTGWLYIPTPEERIKLPAGCASGFGVYLPAAAATLAGWVAGVTYREV